MGYDTEAFEALRTVLEAIASQQNLIASDFADIEAEETSEPLLQSPGGGVRIAFTIGGDAIGKLNPPQAVDAAFKHLLA